MCKIIFQILLSMTISFQLIAQTRLIKSLNIGNEWFYKQGSSIHGLGHHACSFAYKITKNTLIDNDIFYQFKQILGQVYAGSAMYAWSRYYERADSVRVEAIVGLYAMNDREIIYDFSIDIGDTLFYPMIHPGPLYTHYVTTIAKGDAIICGENLPYLKIRSLNYLYGWWGSSTIVAVEKFGVIYIYYQGVDERYGRQLTGALIDGVAYGDMTNTFPGIKSVTPSNNSLNSELSPVISMSFYGSRDAALLTDANILVYAAHSGAQFINTMNYNPDTQILDFTLKSPLTPGEDVTVTLNSLYYDFRFKTKTTGGPGIFSKSDEFVLPYTSSVLKAGDFDLDGDLDLISGSRPHAITLIKNDSENGFIVIPSPVL